MHVKRKLPLRSEFLNNTNQPTFSDWNNSFINLRVFRTYNLRSTPVPRGGGGRILGSSYRMRGRVPVQVVFI